MGAPESRWGEAMQWVGVGGSNPLIPTPTQLIMASPLKALSPWIPWLLRYHFWPRLYC